MKIYINAIKIKTKRKLNVRDKRYDIIINCIGTNILTEVEIYCPYDIIYPYVSKQFESRRIN